MIGQIVNVGSRVSVERKVGTIRLTITVEEEEGPDHSGRPLPPPRGVPGMPRVTMPWTEIGRRTNLIAHEFINEMCADA